MPRFDVHQTIIVEGFEWCHSKVRVSGDNPVDAAVQWAKNLGLPKANAKDVRILGNSTKLITAEYEVGDTSVEIILIPVESTRQCNDCGYPKEATNITCMGQCEEWRNEPEAIVMDIENAEKVLNDAF